MANEKKKIKKLLLKLYYFGNLPQEKKEYYQTIIREIEWQAVEKFIPEKSEFLDIGCGRGYAMNLAYHKKQCRVTGIDPQADKYYEQYERTGNEYTIKPNFKIIKHNEEILPFDNKQFDIVYCSHVLEHIPNKILFLKEVKRVLRDEGVFIAGMPTLNMAIINMITNYLFTTHHRIVNFIFRKSTNFNKSQNSRFIDIFIPPSHSFSDKTLLYDLKNYHYKKWKKILENEFQVREIIFPALYCYPDFLQIFKIRRLKKVGSSVFFVCKKRAVRNE